MANLWNPLYLPYGSLTNWYDSTDTTTLTLSTNDTVANWRDKSYDANNLSETDFADLPTYGTTNLNGLSTVDFSDGASVNLDIPEVSIAQPLYVLFAGFQETFNSTSTYFVLSNEIGAEALKLRLDSSTNMKLIYNTGAGGNVTIPVGNGKKDDQTAIYTISAASLSGTCEFNFNSGGNNTTGLSPMGADSFNQLTLGSSAEDTGGLNGQIGEFIIVQGSISTDDAKKLEGYTAWKWGQEGSLPVGHPYKLAAPTVTDVEFRNKLYETSTEEGSSRFRRLFALGYVG
jgi:hypothetical protein